jgi:hypothetical protein
MGRRKKHHIVFRGFQRHFAVGEQLLVVDKESLTWFPAGTADLFVAKDFNTWFGPQGADDSLETTWGRIETAALARVRRLGTRSEQPGDREAAKDIAALHLARSASRNSSSTPSTRRNRLATRCVACSTTALTALPFPAPCATRSGWQL